MDAAPSTLPDERGGRGPIEGEFEAGGAYSADRRSVVLFRSGPAPGEPVGNAIHQVAHAVDVAGGFSDRYCIENPAGGNWQRPTSTQAILLQVIEGDPGLSI
jgi:hypothetical protein